MTSDLVWKYTFFIPIRGNQESVSIKKGLRFYGKIKSKEILTVFFDFLFLFLAFCYKMGLGEFDTSSERGF